jgi:predicted XRE-type DNA-binding protein
MRTKPTRGGAKGQTAMEWARERANDADHRAEIQTLMTEIDVRQDLIALREASGLTQAQLAERLGVQQPLISKLERDGTKDVKLSTLVKVAAALGARVRVTFERDEAAARTKRRKAAVA